MDNKSPEAFRTISEVADWLGVPAHVLRFWESRFGQVKPVKRAGGRRYYRPGDMELLGGIRKLLHEDGMTIRGVQKLLRENGVKYVAAMSPPLDQRADLRDVSASDGGRRNAAADSGPAESDRHAPVFNSTAEDAVEISADPERPAPAAAAQDLAAPAEAVPEETVPQETDAAEPASEPAPAREPAPEAAPGDATRLGASETPDIEETETAETANVEPVVNGETATPADESAGLSPLDSPEAIEFFAHEAQPDTGERAGVPPDVMATDAETAPDAPEFAPETALEVTGGEADTTGAVPASGDIESPQATENTRAAPQSQALEPEAEVGDTVEAETEVAVEAESEAEVEVAVEAVVEVGIETETETETETVFAKADAPDQADLAGARPPADAPPASAEPGQAAETPATEHAMPAAAHREPGKTPQDASATQTAPASPATAGADLVMPAIGADPEDDAQVTAPPAVAAALRRTRFHAIVERRESGFNPALLQAYADRLQALSGRLGATPDGRRPF